MKQQIKQEEVVNLLTDEKKAEIKSHIVEHFDDFYTAQELGDYIEEGYIFGEFANSEHYKIDDIMALINEVDLEKNPPVVEPVEPTPVEEVKLDEPVTTLE